MQDGGAGLCWSIQSPALPPYNTGGQGVKGSTLYTVVIVHCTMCTCSASSCNPPCVSCTPQPHRHKAYHARADACRQVLLLALEKIMPALCVSVHIASNPAMQQGCDCRSSWAHCSLLWYTTVHVRVSFSTPCQGDRHLTEHPPAQDWFGRSHVLWLWCGEPDFVSDN